MVYFSLQHECWIAFDNAPLQRVTICKITVTYLHDTDALSITRLFLSDCVMSDGSSFFVYVALRTYSE